MEREVGIDISSNYAFGGPTEAPYGMENNFPPEYKIKVRHKRSSGVFDRIIPTKPRHIPHQRPPVPQNRPNSSTSCDLTTGEKARNFPHVSRPRNGVK